MITIFFLDDEPELCELYEDIFSSDRVIVKAFSDSTELIAQVKIKHPDLIFLDYRMPGLRGDAVAKILPDEIPKYMITGEANPQVDYPFVKILLKPPSIEEIFSIIDQESQKIPA